MRQSTAPLPNFMDSGRLSWTLCYVRFGSGSHLSVSVSPEEYRMSGFLRDHFSVIFVFGANAGFDRDTHLRELRRLVGHTSHGVPREGEPRILRWITPLRVLYPWFDSRYISCVSRGSS